MMEENNFNKKSLLIDKDIHTSLKQHCAKYFVTMKTVTERAILKYIEEQEKKVKNKDDFRS